MLLARTIRTTRGLRLETVAQATGIRASHLARFERGLCGLGVANLRRLAEFYKVSIDTLLAEIPDAQHKDRNHKEAVSAVS